MSSTDDLARLIADLARLANVPPGQMQARLVAMKPDELAAMLDRLPAQMRDGLTNLPSLRPLLGPDQWVPNPGPQTDAYNSEADVLLFGGQPGGGKSALLLGLAFTRHKRSFIMRREYGDLERLIEDALKIHGGRDGFNGSPPPRLRLPDGRLIYFRAAHLVGDEQGTMGQGRDLLGIDESTQFAESQVRFLMGWVRSEDPSSAHADRAGDEPAAAGRGPVGCQDVRAVAGRALSEPCQARRAAVGRERRGGARRVG